MQLQLLMFGVKKKNNLPSYRLLGRQLVPRPVCNLLLFLHSIAAAFCSATLPTPPSPGKDESLLKCGQMTAEQSDAKELEWQWTFCSFHRHEDDLVRVVPL